MSEQNEPARRAEDSVAPASDQVRVPHGEAGDTSDEILLHQGHQIPARGATKQAPGSRRREARLISSGRCHRAGARIGRLERRDDGVISCSVAVTPRTCTRWNPRNARSGVSLVGCVIARFACPASYTAPPRPAFGSGGRGVSRGIQFSPRPIWSAWSLLPLSSLSRADTSGEVSGQPLREPPSDPSGGQGRVGRARRCP